MVFERTGTTQRSGLRCGRVMGTLSCLLSIAAVGCDGKWEEAGRPALIDPFQCPPDGGVGGPMVVAEIPEPLLGEPVQAENAPPPISGGTLQLSRDRSKLIVS